MQNVIAQRNHRRRLKEQSIASSEDNSDHHEHHDPSTLPSDQSAGLVAPDGLQNFSSTTPSRTMDAIMANEMPTRSSSPWPGLEPMMPNMPAGDVFPSDPNSIFLPLSQGCTCNGMTGPCARHLEEIRFQVFNNAMAVAPPPVQPYTKGRTGNIQYEGRLGLPATAFEASSAGGIDVQQGPPGILHHRPSYHSLSASTATSGPKSNNSEPHLSHGRSNLSATSKRSTTPSPSIRGAPNTTPTSEESASLSNAVSPQSDVEIGHNNNNHHHHHNVAAAAGNSARFKPILEVVRAAGFPDFDRMVAAYYTASFEKNSVPDMAQRASRGRRLAKVLKDLHESSSRWPRWEARGFRETTMEGARTVCVDEIEKVTQQLGRTYAFDKGESLSALNRLRASKANANAMSIDTDSAEENRLLAHVTTLPDEIEAAVQDEAPYLWSLFTELAGPHGLYCDRVSQAVLALLINGRRESMTE